MSDEISPREVGPVRQALGHLTRRERLTYFVLVIVRALSSVLDVVGVLLIGVVVGIGAGQLGPGGPVSILGIEIPSVAGAGMIWLVLVVLAVFAGKAVLAVGVSILLTRFAARIDAEKAARIMSHILRGSLTALGRRTRAEYQFAVTESVGNAFTNILLLFGTVVSEGGLVALLALTLIAVDPITAVVVIIYFGLVIGVLQYIIGRRIRRAGRAATEATIQSAGVLHDALDSYREMVVLGRVPYFLGRFRVPRRSLADNVARMAVLGSMPRYIVETALILGVVGFVAFLFFAGGLASGMVTLGVFLVGGVRIMGSLLPLQSALAQLKASREGALLAYEMLDEADAEAPPQPSAAPPEVEVGDLGLPVSLTGVSFTYPGTSRPALADVTLDILPGHRVAFIGPSGAGKTTLVDVLLGLIRPDSGEVRIAGVDCETLRSARPGLIGYVPQRPGLVAGSIAENVAFGVEPDRIDEDRVREALRAAHLGEFVAGLADDIHASVGKQNSALSGGQIQRLGLARALYFRPRLLILDEATSALDATSEAFITATLDELGDHVTIIVIAHRLSTVQNSDVVHLVEEGRITASGAFDDLRRRVPTVAEFVKHMSLDD